MLREELNEKDTWDLTTIFANNEEFEKAFNNANIEIENIKKYENRNFLPDFPTGIFLRETSPKAGFMIQENSDGG